MVDDENEKKDLAFIGGQKLDFTKTISQGSTNVVNNLNINLAHDVTPAAAAAMAHRDEADVKVSENTHVIPSREKMKRLYAQLVFNGGAALGLGWLAKASGIKDGWMASVIIALAALFGPGIKQAIEALTKKGD